MSWWNGWRMRRGRDRKAKVGLEGLRAGGQLRVWGGAAAKRRELALVFAHALRVTRLHHHGHAHRARQRRPPVPRCHGYLVLSVANVHGAQDPIVARACHATRRTGRERRWANARRPVTRRWRSMEAHLDEHVSLCARRLAQVIEQSHADPQQTARADNGARAVEGRCLEEAVLVCDRQLQINRVFDGRRLPVVCRIELLTSPWAQTHIRMHAKVHLLRSQHVVRRQPTVTVDVSPRPGEARGATDALSLTRNATLQTAHTAQLKRTRRAGREGATAQPPAASKHRSVAMACDDRGARRANLACTTVSLTHKLDDSARDQADCAALDPQSETADMHTRTARARACIRCDELRALERIVQRARESINYARRAAGRIEHGRVERDFDLIVDKKAVLGISMHRHAQMRTRLLELQA